MADITTKEQLEAAVTLVNSTQLFEALLKKLKLETFGLSNNYCIKVRSLLIDNKTWDKPELVDILWTQVQEDLISEARIQVEFLELELLEAEEKRLGIFNRFQDLRKQLQSTTLSTQDTTDLSTRFSQCEISLEDAESTVESLTTQLEKVRSTLSSLLDSRRPSSPPHFDIMAEGGALKALNIPQYFGEIAKDNLSARAWCKQVNSCMKLSGWDSARTAQFALLTLRSTAAVWANSRQDLDGKVFDKWEDLQELFLKRFHIKKTLAELSYLKSTLVQANNELVRDFWDRCITAQLLFDETWVDLPSTATKPEKDAFKQAKEQAHTHSVQLTFISGVNEAIRSKLLIDQCKTSEEILDLAERVESSVRDQKKVFTDTSKLEVATIRGGRGRGGFSRGRGPQRGRGTNSSTTTTTRLGVCFRCGDNSHYADTCPQKGQNTRGRGFRGRTSGGYFGRGRGTNPSRPFLRNTASINMGSHDDGDEPSSQSYHHLQQQQQSQSHSNGSRSQSHNNGSSKVGHSTQHDPVEQDIYQDPYLHISNAMVSLNPHAQ